MREQATKVVTGGKGLMEDLLWKLQVLEIYFRIIINKALFLSMFNRNECHKV